MFTTKEQVRQKLYTLCYEQLGVAQGSITDESSFEMDLGADSLDAVELVMAVEQDFDLTPIPDREVDNLKTVGAVLKYICERLAIEA